MFPFMQYIQDGKAEIYRLQKEGEVLGNCMNSPHRQEHDDGRRK